MMETCESTINRVTMRKGRCNLLTSYLKQSILASIYPGTDISASKREIPWELVTTSLDDPSEVTTAK